MTAAEIATGLFEVLSGGDPRFAAHIVAPDFQNREAALAPPACAIPGPAGVLASGAWMRSAFDDLRFPVLGVAVNDEQVWVRLRMRGLHTGPFVRFRGGRVDTVLPPTGREIDFEQIHVLNIHGQQVVGHEAVRDDVTMLSQLGAFPPTPSMLGRMAFWKLSRRASRAAESVAALSETAAEAAITSPG